MCRVGLNPNMSKLTYRQKPVIIADFFPFLSPVRYHFESCIILRDSGGKDPQFPMPYFFDDDCLISIGEIVSSLTGTCAVSNHLNLSVEQFIFLTLYFERASFLNVIWKFFGYNQICGKILRAFWFWSLPTKIFPSLLNGPTVLPLRIFIKCELKSVPQIIFKFERF